MSYKTDIRKILSFNFIFSSILFSIYPLVSGNSAVEYIFLIPALFSAVFLIYLAFSPLILILHKIPFAGKWILTAFFTLFHSLTLLDLAIYKIFKFHINAMVIDLIFTPGGLSTLDQSVKMVMTYCAAVIILGLISYRLIQFSSGNGKRVFSIILILSFSCLIAEKAMSAWAVSADYTPFTKNFKVYPLYQPLKMRSFMEKTFGLKPQRDEIKFSAPNSGLKYPLKPIEMAENSKMPNIVLIVIDSLRFDMFNPEIMPNSFNFAKKTGASVFLNHYSGGNATRFGIFSIFYGLYGNYWEKILGERRSPVLMDILNKSGYETGVFASARVTYPEFDRTCFVSVPYSAIFDKPQGDKVAKDRAITEAALKFIENSKKPFFAFIFYDALHGSYDYPPDMEKFSGAAKEVDHIFLRPSNINSAFLRYKNSAYFEDSLSGKITAFLENKKMLSNTIVVITGDHGEPFYERGYYGHNQGYCDYEIKSPLILHAPGRKKVSTAYPTSHMDIAPTLLYLLGIKNPAQDFSNGLNLYDAKSLSERKFLAAFSWDSAALIRPLETMVFSMETYNLSDFAFYDSSYKQIKRKKTPEDILLLKEFWTEASKFYK